MSNLEGYVAHTSDWKFCNQIINSYVVIDTQLYTSIHLGITKRDPPVTT